MYANEAKNQLNFVFSRISSINDEVMSSKSYVIGIFPYSLNAHPEARKLSFYILIFLPMPRLYEKSAGGIIYRKIDSKIEVLLLEWKNSREIPIYVIPK
jgi:hypothetical protein